jgi:tetratricopeptide (TPR) repeat protein
VTAVLSLDSQTFLGHNQETYQDLRSALVLNLRRQLLIAVCDDVALQYQLAQRLTHDLRPGGPADPDTPPLKPDQSPIVTIQLDSYTPDLVRQVLLWLKQHRRLKGTPQTIPAFQILGIERLTRQSLTVQNRFLASLIRVDALLTQLDCRLLVWVPRPWLGKIQQAVPGFWRSRSALFEFVGDPTAFDEPHLPPPMEPIVPDFYEPTPPPQGISDASAPSPAPTEVKAAPVTVASASSSSSRVSSRLWQVMQEDLAGFEQRMVTRQDAQVPASGPSNQTSTPSVPPVPIDEPPSTQDVLPPEPAPTSDEQSSPFTVIGDATLSTVIMPPLEESSADELAWLQTLDDLEELGKHPPAAKTKTTTEARSTQSSVAVAATVPPTARQPAPAVTPPATGNLDTVLPRPLDVPIPAELVDDAELMRLWEYTATIMAQQAGPLTLSRAFLGLGQISRDRIAPDHPQEPILNFAIAAYHRAIDGMLAGEPDWCDALNDLAGLYWLQSQIADHPDAKADWLQRAIQRYQEAIAGAQPSATPETLVRLYSNLGTALSMLASWVDPVPVLSQSLKAYHQALQYTPVDQNPAEYANLQNIIGAVHWRLAQLDRPHHHLHCAINSYSEALRYHSPHEKPMKYAMLQNNLGIAYWSLAQHERPAALLQQAVYAYQSALAYRTQASDPAGCAATHNNLGTALWDLAQQQHQPEQRLASLQQAIVAYEAALNAAEVALHQTPPPTLGFDIWATFHSAGVVHDHIAQALSVDQLNHRQRHLQQALGHYLLAFQGWHQQPQQLEVLVTALVHNVHLHFEILGIAGQQTALSQVPGELLPEVLQRL